MEMGAEGTLKGGKEALAELVSSVTKVAGIPINKEFLDYVFKDNKPKNAFSYIIKLFEEVKNSGKQPVLILDELQKIGDVKVNGFLIYELFNFFIDLTKEKHLAHVFVATSDSLFIEQIYNEAMLQGRCDYLLVDDFDYEVTMDFLDSYGWGEHEKEISWNCIGGKPVYLVKLINAKVSEKKIRDVLDGMLVLRTGEIKTTLKRVKELGSEIRIENSSYAVNYMGLVDTLKCFVERDEIDMGEVDEISTTFLVKKNILFVDPLTTMMKPQSKLNLLAIREVIANV